MADTIQSVGWLLEKECPFRKGDAISSAAAAWSSTANLSILDRVEREGDVYGEFAVCGTSYSGKGVEPGLIFRVSEMLGGAPSIAAVRKICHQCPANATGRVAGCRGSFGPDPDDPELERALRKATRPLGNRYRQAFLQTRPIWYGLWTVSPLSQQQLQLFPDVLGAVARSDADTAHFVEACRRAMQHGMNLHVSLAPLGHTDLGWSTTFPHCPRCKKHQGERWETSYTSTQVTCPACGARYVPAATAAAEEMDSAPIGHLLDPVPREKMPDDQWNALCAAWRQRHPDIPKTMSELFASAPNLQATPRPRRFRIIAVALIVLWIVIRIAIALIRQ